MNLDALIAVMTAAVVVLALALVAQTLMIFGMYRSLRSLRSEVLDFLPNLKEWLVSSGRAIEESKQQVRDVTTKASAVLDTTQKQLERVDEVLGEATGRAKVQMERVEIVLDDTISRVHDTVVQLNNGILRPLRELNALAAGLRAAFQHLLRGGRPTVAQATADEEMFI